MTTIYLVRHGEYENPHYRVPGRGPGFPLSDRGRRQVALVANYMQSRHIAVLYSSPIVRTRQTAEIISAAVNLPIVFDERLLEVGTNLEGTSMTDMDAIGGNVYTPELHEKGAESIEDLVARLNGFIVEKRTEHEGKEILCISHGDPIRFIVMHYMNIPLDFRSSRAIATPLAGGYSLTFGNTGSVAVEPIHFT